MNGLTDDHLKRCVFEAKYKKIGVNQWIRIDAPEIVILDDEDDEAANYAEPICEDITTDTTKQIVQIRVFDKYAISPERQDLLGDYSNAAQRCDNALTEHFNGDTIVESNSHWHL